MLSALALSLESVAREMLCSNVVIPVALCFMLLKTPKNYLWLSVLFGRKLDVYFVSACLISLCNNF